MLKVAGLNGLFKFFAVGVVGLSLSACDDVTKWNQADTSSSASSSTSSISTYALSGTVSGNTGTLTLYNNSAYVCEIPYVGSSSASSTSGKLCSATPTTSTSNGTFSVNLPAGYAYSVTFIGPQGQVCAVAPSTTYAISGTVKAGTLTAAVPGIAITCTSSLNLKGTVSGLVSGTALYLDNTTSYVTTLSAAVIASATTVSVASAAALPVGATILVDSEQMNITAVSGTTLTVTRGVNGTVIADHASGKGVRSLTPITANTGNNVTTLSAAVPASATAISVASASALPVGATILVDSEQMNITAVSGTTLTVTRGVNGTVIADHAIGKGVSSLLFTFFKATSGNYNVAITTQPTGQTCTFGGSASSVTGNQTVSDITNVAITCVQNLYSLTVNISGLTSADFPASPPLKVSLNGAAPQSLLVLAPTLVTNAKIAYGASYSVAVTQQPTNKTCTFTGGGTSLSGVMNAISTADLTCVPNPPNTYIVGGAVSGLGNLDTITLTIAKKSAAAVPLQQIPITGNKVFAFNPLQNDVYTVTVSNVPDGKECPIFNGEVTVENSNNYSVLVQCTDTIRTIGGTNSPGATLTATGSTASSGNNITSAGGAFSMNAKQGDVVSIYASKAGYSCSVTGVPTTPVTINVTNVSVSCLALDVTINGSNPDGATVTVTGSANGPLSSSSNPLSFSVKYDDSLTITASNVGIKVCSPNPTSIPAVNFTPPAIVITCSDVLREIRGTVTGLDTVVLNNSLTLKNNNGDPLSITSNGDFKFANKIADGSAYNVTIDSSSVTTGQNCSVTHEAGTANADVTDVSVTCVYEQFTVGGTVTGNVGEVTLTNNNNVVDAQVVASNGGSFIFAPQDYNTPYDVVASQPVDETCLVFNGSGDHITGDVTVTVTCAATTYTIGGTIRNLTGSVTLAAYSDDPSTTVVSANGAFTLTSTRTKGQAYAVAVTAQPVGYTCTITGGDNNDGSGTVATTDVTSVIVDCATLVPYTLGVNLSGVPVGTSTTPLASYLIIQDQDLNTRAVVYGSGNPVAGTGNVTFGTPAAWASQLPVTNNSLVVNAGKLYLVNYGGGVQCTVGTTAPTGTTVGLPQVIAATEQPVDPVTSLPTCTTTVNLTYVGPYSGTTAATYTPFTYTIGQSYSLTITSNPTNATCSLNDGVTPAKGIGETYSGTFTGGNVFVPVRCEYAGATMSGTITGYGTPSTAIVGGVQIEATATWSLCSVAGTCTLTAVTPTAGGTLNDIQPGYQVWADGNATVGAVTLTNGGMGLSANTYVGAAYVPGNATMQITTVTTMAQTVAQNIVITGGGVSTYYGMKLTVTGTAVDNTPISYTTDALAANATTFTIPTTYVFKAGTSYNVTISTPPTYPAGSERTCTVYNGNNIVVPTDTNSTPVINNLLVDCGLNTANSRLLVGNSASVQTTALLGATPTAPALPGGAPYTAVTFPDIKSFNSLYATNGNYLAYVLNSPASGAGSLALLQVTTAGATSAPTATAPAVQTLTLGNNPYGVAVSSGVVIATNTTDNNMTVATNTGPGTLTLVGNTTIGTGNSQPRGVAFHPSNGFAYVVASGSNAVYPFTANMGATALADKAGATSIATGATPYNIAVDSSGRFAYVTNYGAQTISMYSICQFTTLNCVRGTLSSLGTVSVPAANPEYIVADASSVLVTTAGGDVYHYAINLTTGILTLTGNSVTVATGISGITLGNERNVFYVTSPGGVAPYGYSSSGIGAAGTTLTTVSNPVGTSLR